MALHLKEADSDLTDAKVGLIIFASSAASFDCLVALWPAGKLPLLLWSDGEMAEEDRRRVG